jgi:hypothetical protein
MPSVATRTAGTFESSKPAHEVADIFRLYGGQYRRRYRLPLSHLKVMQAIEVCRTAYLGGHVERCDRCGFERVAYNSCRNRHCPKCQALAKAQWLEKRSVELLPIGYFHVVFTLPHELNALTLCNKKSILGLLFEVVSQTLMEFTGDPKHGLGGRPGFTAILHTWDQKLMDHFHLHCLLAGGALSFNGERFVCAKNNYLFPVRALSKVFRGRFIDSLRRIFANGDLIFPGKIAHVGTPKGFSSLISQLWQKDWIVYSKAPFNGPQKVLDYLGRYTHRVAIANHRIMKIADGSVTFGYRDRRDGDKCKQMTITAEEFIRRFLLHVLPDSFVRIRHYGFLASRRKKRDLPKCRALLDLDSEPPQLRPETTQQKILRLTGVDLAQCPCCGQGCMRRVRELPMVLVSVSQNSQILPEVLDTS